MVRDGEKRQYLLIYPSRTGFPGIFSCCSHSLSCLIPLAASRASGQLREGEVKQRGTRWFLMGEGRKDSISATWMFTNRKAGLEIQNSYGNFYFSLHLKKPQPSKAQALFSVKLLAQSLKMRAAYTLKQQICCSCLCKVHVSGYLLHSGGSVYCAVDEKD